MALREASFGLGAQRHQTSFRVVVPAGISGIVAAFILGMSRAIGETMVVAIAAGAVGGGLFRLTPLEPGQTMTAAMAALGFGSDQVAGDDLAFQSLYFVGLLLFFMTFLLNFVSDRLVAARVRRGVLRWPDEHPGSGRRRSGPQRHRADHEASRRTSGAR